MATATTTTTGGGGDRISANARSSHNFRGNRTNRQRRHARVVIVGAPETLDTARHAENARAGSTPTDASIRSVATGSTAARAPRPYERMDAPGRAGTRTARRRDARRYSRHRARWPERCRVLAPLLIAAVLSSVVPPSAGIDPTPKPRSASARRCGQDAHAEFLRDRLDAHPRRSDGGPGCPRRGPCDDPKRRDAFPIGRLAIRVWIHVMRSGDGVPPDGVDDARVAAQLAFLSRDLHPYALAVELVNVTYHDDERYWNISSDDRRFDDAVLRMKRRYAVDPPRLLNAFVMSSPGDLMGFGTFPFESYATDYAGGLWLNSRYFGWGNRTFVHELGHCAGLYHTFEGSSDADACGTPCAELVHPAGDPRAELVGDLCADTPATDENFACADPPRDSTDCAGESFGRTDHSNHMSYAPDECVDHFTRSQASRMHCWLCTGPAGGRVDGCPAVSAA